MSTRLWTNLTIESTSLAAIRSRPASSLRIAWPSPARASASQRAAVAMHAVQLADLVDAPAVERP
jgi:hypothetical protein